MVSLKIPPLASLQRSSDLKFPDGIPAAFESLVTLYHQLSAFFRSESGDSIISFLIYAAITFLAITLSACIFSYSNRKKKPLVRAADFEPEVNDGSPEGVIVEPMDADEYSHGVIGEIVSGADAAYADEATSGDADYAEEIQLQETLLASIFTSQLENNPSSSMQQPILGTEIVRLENGAHQSFCEICLENKESWEMCTNNKCFHSFCYQCTTSHIVAKIEDKAKEIPCPALNCKALLNYDSCRLMIPDSTLVQWNEMLCMALIPESQKLYCPFRDCSAMLVNDSGALVREIKCLLCKRSFCAECRVPWHSEFTCKEFQKLYAKKRGREDEILKMLAKKKKWQKCPKCKMYVERTEGCPHMTCRCRYQFCYRCGAKWSDPHKNCKPNS